MNTEDIIDTVDTIETIDHRASHKMKLRMNLIKARAKYQADKIQRQEYREKQRQKEMLDRELKEIELNQDLDNLIKRKQELINNPNIIITEDKPLIKPEDEILKLKIELERKKLLKKLEKLDNSSESEDDEKITNKKQQPQYINITNQLPVQQTPRPRRSIFHNGFV